MKNPAALSAQPSPPEQQVAYDQIKTKSIKTASDRVSSHFPVKRLLIDSAGQLLRGFLERRISFEVREKFIKPSKTLRGCVRENR